MDDDQPEPTQPSGLRDRKRVATRARIADAAWQLFEEHGFEDVTLSQVADHAEVSRRNLFHYFASKEALLFPGLDEYVAELAAALAARPADEPVLDAFAHALQEARTRLDRDAADRSADQPAVQPTVPAAVRDRQSSPAALAYLQDHLARAITAVTADRFADDPDGALKARIAGGVAGLLVSVAAELRAATGGTGPLADHADAALDLLRAVTTPSGLTTTTTSPSLRKRSR